MQVRAVNPRLALVLAALALAASAPASAQAPAGPPALASGDTNVAGVVAELTECKRKAGVLSIKVRFRNSSATDANLNLIDGRNYDMIYLTAADKKYFVLRDSEQTPVAAQADGFGNLHVKLAPGGSWTWWAKYPAPPPEIKAFSFYMPVGPPIEDVPITDP